MGKWSANLPTYQVRACNDHETPAAAFVANAAANIKAKAGGGSKEVRKEGGGDGCSEICNFA